MTENREYTTENMVKTERLAHKNVEMVSKGEKVRCNTFHKCIPQNSGCGRLYTQWFVPVTATEISGCFHFIFVSSLNTRKTGQSRAMHHTPVAMTTAGVCQPRWRNEFVSRRVRDSENYDPKKVDFIIIPCSLVCLGRIERVTGYG